MCSIKPNKQYVKLIRQLCLTSHFWDAFEAGDERVMETLVTLWPGLRYRGREVIWGCVINKALGSCLIQTVSNTKSSPLGGRRTQPGRPSTTLMAEPEAGIPPRTGCSQLTQGLGSQMVWVIGLKTWNKNWYPCPQWEQGQILRLCGGFRINSVRHWTSVAISSFSKASQAS